MFWTLSLCLNFLLFAVSSSCDESKPRPNVIIFLADDLGYGDPGYSGHPTSVTPNLDKLAGGSKIIRDFYVTSPVCSPSR